MSTTRSSSLRILKQLSSHSQQARQLHITGPVNLPSRALNLDKAAILSLPKDINGLRAECIKRGVPSAGNKDELLARLASPATRTFVTNSQPTRPSRSDNPSTATTNITPQSRHINTSRALKAPKDSSTIDFAFLPSEPAPNPVDNVNLRVPLLPDSYSPNRTGALAHPLPTYETVTRQEVVTTAADSTHISAPSVMSDVHDNTAAPVDFHELAERLENAAGVVREKARNSQGTMRQLWEGVMDDIFGPKRSGGMA